MDIEESHKYNGVKEFVYKAKNGREEGGGGGEIREPRNSVKANKRKRQMYENYETN
jgi:hypothetical protein